MRRGFVIALVLSGFILSPAVATGADVTVTPSVGLKGEYNDNIDYAAKDKKDDYIGSVTPGLKLEYLTPRFSMKTEGKAEIQRYLDMTEDNTEKYNVSLDAGYRFLQKSNIFAQASFTRDTTLDKEFNETGLVVKRENMNTYTGGLGFVHYLSANTSTGLAYQYQKKEYSGDFYTDSDGHNVTARLDYTFNDGLDTVSIQPMFAVMTSDLARVNQYGGMLGLTHRISDTAEASVGAGALYSELTDRIAGEETTAWGWIAEAGLKKQWETFSLSFNFSRQNMFDALSSFVTVNRFLLLADYNLTERFSLQLRGGMYFTKSSEVEKEVGTDERSFFVSPKLSYKFTEHIRLDLAYTYSKTKDYMLEEGENEWNRNQVWFLLSFEFPEKL